MPVIRCFCPLKACKSNQNGECHLSKIPTFKSPETINVEHPETGATLNIQNERLECQDFEWDANYVRGFQSANVLGVKIKKNIK